MSDIPNDVMAEIGLDRAIIIEGEHNKGHKKSAPYDKIFIFGCKISNIFY